jgi:pimeloyl-ACP methyl ester carboxylesterase
VPAFHVETFGSGPRVVLIHGSGDPASAWGGQRELAGRYAFVKPIRSGYPPNPPLPQIDFERQAAELAPLLEDGAHLVGHSYGGLIALLIAGREPERVRSLLVSEPPAFGVAAGNPVVDALVAELDALFSERSLDPAEHLRRFVAIVGVSMEVPAPLPPELEAATRATMVERPPWEAELPFSELRAAPFRKLVLSGGHRPAFDVVCDVIAERAGADRAVLSGKGHGIPRAPDYNATLARFLEGA